MVNDEHFILFADRSRLDRKAFTLVELLVVIGIIALLIGILMPALSAARRSAQRTSCALKLQHMFVAAQVHAADHKGYYPVAGVMGYLTPEAMADRDKTHYEYLRYSEFDANNVVCPITHALAKEMVGGHALIGTNNPEFSALDNDPSGLSRYFWCPSQGAVIEDFKQYFTLYTGFVPGYPIYFAHKQSYIFNEAVLGFDDAYGRLRGHASAIRQPSKTMFAADGVGGFLGVQRPSSFIPNKFNGELAMATLYNTTAKPPVTMGDAISGRKIGGYVVAGDSQSFDLIRHRGKMNIVFCDGHVETRDINFKSLSPLFLLAP